MLESTSSDPVVQSIDRATIAGVAQAALEAPADLVDWRVEAINPGWGSATGAMYRVSGSALVMIDWAYVGCGELGLDAGDLFAASYSLFGVEPCEPRELDRVVFENYLDGLRATGWAGDWRAARFGYATYAALKYGCLTFWLRDAGDPPSHAAWERLAGCIMAAYVENHGRLVAYLLDLADEARDLLEAVDGKQ